MQKKKTTLPRKIIKIFLFLSLLAAIIGGGYWYFQDLRTITVKTKTIARGLFLYTVTSTSSGTLKADRIAKVASRINGRAVRINFSEWNRVKEGEELIVLEPEEATANTKMAEANLTLAKVRYEQAKAVYELEKKLVDSRVSETEATLKEAASALRRTKDMMKQGIYSSQQLDSATKNFDVAKAACDSAVANRETIALKEKEMLAAKAEIQQMEEALKIALIQRNYLSILAPFDGIVSLKSVEVGEMVLPGEPLLEILDDKSIYIHAPIDEADLYKIQLGQEVKISIDAYPNKKFIGKLYEISPIISQEKQEGRTVSVKVSLDSQGEVLRSGMSCDVEILVDQIPGALLVPTNLLMGRDDTKYVFVVENDIVKKRVLSLGLSNWDYTVVTKGIEEGKEIISSIDILNLKEGSRVTVEKEKM
jgi:HlyD family secretion protein